MSFLGGVARGTQNIIQMMRDNAAIKEEKRRYDEQRAEEARRFNIGQDWQRVAHLGEMIGEDLGPEGAAPFRRLGLQSRLTPGVDPTQQAALDTYGGAPVAGDGTQKWVLSGTPFQKMQLKAGEHAERQREREVSDWGRQDSFIEWLKSNQPRTSQDVYEGFVQSGMPSGMMRDALSPAMVMQDAIKEAAALEQLKNRADSILNPADKARFVLGIITQQRQSLQSAESNARQYAQQMLNMGDREAAQEATLAYQTARAEKERYMRQLDQEVNDIKRLYDQVIGISSGSMQGVSGRSNVAPRASGEIGPTRQWGGSNLNRR